MIIIAGAILGVILGVLTARRRQGSKLDMAQYGASMGIAFALVGLIITVMIHRQLV